MKILTGLGWWRRNRDVLQPHRRLHQEINERQSEGFRKMMQICRVQKRRRFGNVLPCVGCSSWNLCRQQRLRRQEDPGQRRRLPPGAISPEDTAWWEISEATLAIGKTFIATDTIEIYSELILLIVQNLFFFIYHKCQGNIKICKYLIAGNVSSEFIYSYLYHFKI